MANFGQQKVVDPEKNMCCAEIKVGKIPRIGMAVYAQRGFHPIAAYGIALFDKLRRRWLVRIFAFFDFIYIRNFFLS